MTSLPLAISFSVRHRLPRRTSSLSVPLPLPVPAGLASDGPWSGCRPGLMGEATGGGAAAAAAAAGGGVAGSALGSEPDEEGRGVTAFE